MSLFVLQIAENGPAAIDGRLRVFRKYLSLVFTTENVNEKKNDMVMLV